MDPDSLPVQAITHLARKPTDKWDLPATTSQETGWLLSNPVRADTLSPPAPTRRSRSSGALPGQRRKKSHKTSETPVVAPPMGITAPTNDGVLQRNMSTPALGGGEPMKQLTELNSKRWHRPKGLCDVTTYAEAYHSMMHHNPFDQ